MELVVLLTACIFIMTISEYLEKIVKPSFNKEIASKLISFPNKERQKIIFESNQIFLKLFDRIYITNSENNFYLWFWIFLSTIFTIIFGLNYQINHIVVPDLDKLLLLSLILPTFTVLYMKIVNFRAITSKKKRFVFYSYIIAIGQLTFLFVHLISKNNYFYSVLYRLFSIEITYNQINSIVIGFIYGNLLLTLFIYVYFEKFQFLEKLSPIRAISSSFIAMLLVGLLSTLFNGEIAQSFISDLNSIGITILAYVFLNIFADSISLWETSYVLRVAANGSISRFYSLIIFDILISALIFLVIPWSTGNIDVFFEAIKFQGDVPWLGILFWSTFFTSITFWIFIITVVVLIILQKILMYFNKIEPFFYIKEKPIRCLGLVSMIPFSVIFILLLVIMK